MCQDALDAFAKYGSTPGVLFIDGPSDGYDGIRLPAGWVSERGEKTIAESMRWLFETYPNEDWYGWIADDNRPLTKDFDLKLIAAAAGGNFVFCNDSASKPRKNIGTPNRIPSAMLWSGDLVREVGWWSPAWLRHTCLDELWRRLAIDSKRTQYCKDVGIAHIHWKNGGRRVDATDERTLMRNKHIRADAGRLFDWFETQEYFALVKRLRENQGDGVASSHHH